MLRSATVETAVGAFMALGLGALLILAMQVSNLSFASLASDEGYRITARFDNVGGLKVKSPVKLAGVVIGRVVGIDVDPESYEAVVTMRIDSRYDTLPTDSTANIYTAGLLGEQYVAIDPGADDSYLTDGDELMLTQSAIVLEQVIGRVLYDKAAGGD